MKLLAAQNHKMSFLLGGSGLCVNVPVPVCKEKTGLESTACFPGDMTISMYRNS